MPASPSTVSYYPLLDLVDGVPALGWYLRWISQLELKLEICIVCDSRVITTVREVVKGAPGVETIVCDGPGQIDALLEAARASHAEECVLLPPGTAFAPPNLISKVLDHHSALCNDYTFVTGLPDGFTPEIYGPKALQILHSFRSIAHRYSRARSGLEAFVAAAAKKDVQGGTPLSSTPFAASAWVAAPRLVGLPEPTDASGFGFALTANRALALLRAKEDSDVLRGLLAWKQSTLETIANRKSCMKRFNLFRADAKQDGTARVLYMQTPGGYSGAEEALCTMIQNLDRTKFTPYAITGSPGYMAQRLHHIGVSVEVANIDFSIIDDQSIAAVIGALRRVRPHLIHLNCIGEQAIALLVCLAGIPLIEHVRINVPSIEQPRLDRNWYRQHTLRYADKIIAVSRLVKHRLFTCDIPSTDIEIVYDGVDVESFRECSRMRQSTRSALHLPDFAFVILLVARFDICKRHDLAIRALARIRQKIPDAYLVIVGEATSRAEGLWESRLLSQVRQLGIEDRMLFVGFQKNIRNVLGAADVLVLCSDEEPLGICVLEAMAARIPTIVTDSCGVAELLENGENSFVVPSSNEQALAEAIKGVFFSAPERLNRLCQNAYETVVTRASARRCAEQIESIYSRCLKGALLIPPDVSTAV